MLDLITDDFPKLYRGLFDKLEEHLALQPMRSKLKPSDPSNHAKIKRYNLLEYLVVEACYEALAYANANSVTPDSLQRRRQRDSDVLKEIPSQIKAIKKLINFINDYPEYSSYALAKCHKSDHARISIKKQMKLSEVWSKFLSIYSDALQEQAFPAKKGPFPHRCQVGALDFGMPIDLSQGRKPEAIVTSLMFHLTLLFRRFDSGLEIAYPDFDIIGATMHANKKSYYDISTLLIEATLDTELSDTEKDRFTRLLRKYPDTKFVGWPAP